MPLLSIIVCTYNREKYIEDTLQYLSNQSIDQQQYEILIIDNNSTDGTASICHRFIENKGHENFHYFLEEKQGLSYARNRGISESKGEFLAFLDDDAWVDNTYCEKIIEFFTGQPDVSVIGGKIIPLYEGTEPSWMTKFLWPLVAGLDMGGEIKEFKYSRYPIGANMAFRASVFKQYGSFNVELGRRGKGLEGGEEKDIVYRLKRDRKKVVYVPSIVARHIIPDSRIQKSYIKSQATGVGTSEKKRLMHEGFKIKMIKTMEELIKILATCILSLFYLLTFRPDKGIMLLRFRVWVIQGFLSQSKP
jgi:glycosyltransferase involved in cell wall biosynthesis